MGLVVVFELINGLRFELNLEGYRCGDIHGYKLKSGFVSILACLSGDPHRLFAVDVCNRGRKGLRKIEGVKGKREKYLETWEQGQEE